MSKTPRVVIEVRGGVAYVQHKDAGVKLTVTDCDTEGAPPVSETYGTEETVEGDTVWCGGCGFPTATCLCQRISD